MAMLQVTMFWKLWNHAIELEGNSVQKRKRRRPTTSPVLTATRQSSSRPKSLSTQVISEMIAGITGIMKSALGEPSVKRVVYTGSIPVGILPNNIINWIMIRGWMKLLNLHGRVRNR